MKKKESNSSLLRLFQQSTKQVCLTEVLSTYINNNKNNNGNISFSIQLKLQLQISPLQGNLQLASLVLQEKTITIVR